MHQLNSFCKSLNSQIRVLVELRNLLFSYLTAQVIFFFGFVSAIFNCVGFVFLNMLYLKANSDCLIQSIVILQHKGLFIFETALVVF